MSFRLNRIAGAAALIPALTLVLSPLAASAESVQIGPRPYFLVDALRNPALKDKLESCEIAGFKKTKFSIGHRGAPLQFPEHSKESYLAAARMGAGVIECDVTFTKDRELVCRHSQCDLHTTTNILLTPLADKCTQPFKPAQGEEKASAKCCASDITLAEFKTLKGKMDASNPNATTVEEYVGGTPAWRTELYTQTMGGALMTHKESIALIDSLGADFTPELKGPSVEMPFDGDFTQEAYAQKMIDEYKQAGIDPSRVWPQSFNLSDVQYWLAKEPAFGKQAVFLDDRDETQEGFDFRKPETLKPTMAELKAMGVEVLAPPLWMLVDLDENKKIVPSAYAKAANEAGLKLIAWSLERSGPLANGGGWYYQSIKDATDNDGVILELLDVLAQEVKVIGVFSDWPATTSYYANCMGLE